MTDEQIRQLVQDNAWLRKENEMLRQKVDLLVRQMFGRKSEKLDPAQMQLLLGELNDPGQPEASVAVAPMEAESAPRRKRPPRKPRYPEDLPVVEEQIDPEPVKVNPCAWRRIGEEVSEQLDYEPGRFLRRRTVRGTWVKRHDPDGAPVTAPLPPKLLECGILAPGLLAHILISKYADHLPLNRQEQIYRQRHGVELPRQTLARGVELAADWLRPVVTEISRQQHAGGYLQVDETPIKYQDPGRGQTAQGYLWVVHVPGGDTVYHWGPGRGHQCLLDFIPEDYRGVIQCDGYGAYRTFKQKRTEIELVACWAHVRRKFHDAFTQGEAPQQSSWILRQIRHLYATERQLRESRAGPSLRTAVRLHQSRPVITRPERLLRRLQNKHAHPPQSLMGKAISYAPNLWPLLEVYLEDGRLEIDNNLVENAARPTAVGRRNWLFIGREQAGWRSAVIYSIIQSCKAQGAEPYAYLKDVLERLPSMTNHQIPSVTPKAWVEARRILQLLAS